MFGLSTIAFRVLLAVPLKMKTAVSEQNFPGILYKFLRNIRQTIFWEFDEQICNLRFPKEFLKEWLNQIPNELQISKKNSAWAIFKGVAEETFKQEIAIALPEE